MSEEIRQIAERLVGLRDALDLRPEDIASTCNINLETYLGYESGEKDKMAMFADALPKQQKMLMQSSLLIIPFFRQQTQPLLKPAEQSSLNYFASAWCALENMLLAATAEGLGTVFHIPVSDEAEKIKQIVNAPEGYEFTCLLTMGYPTENAFLPKQKEIHIEERIHTDVW